MRQRNVRLMVCFALLFSITWGAGCAATETSAGCSDSCGAQAAPTPSAPAAANNNPALKGNYAFTFTGIKGNGTVSSISAAVGTFTADGAGNLTSGELDTNGVGTGAALIAQARTGTYTIGADNRGALPWNVPAGAAKSAIGMTATGDARL